MSVVCLFLIEEFITFLKSHPIHILLVMLIISVNNKGVTKLPKFNNCCV